MSVPFYPFHFSIKISKQGNGGNNPQQFFSLHSFPSSQTEYKSLNKMMVAETGVNKIKRHIKD